ncbi:MAG: GNAT family N-acetyltransferase [Verrucomicrobiales bacterium]
MNEPIEITVARGAEVLARMDALAELRVRVFREWPYLYDGDTAYEHDYLSTYAKCPEAIVVVASTGGRVIGASTALPLKKEPDTVRAPFALAGLPVESYFYFGESVLLPEFRGRGIGGRFMEERLREASDTGYTWATFCAVERDPADPRRPHGFLDLHPFWASRGFERRADLATEFHWKEIGETESTAKPMVFWVKSLSTNPPAHG